MILTDVDGVYSNWESNEREKLLSLAVREAKKYLSEGQFPSGSMGPKIEAAINFLESGGKEVIIARPEDLLAAMDGRAGTRIVGR